VSDLVASLLEVCFVDDSMAHHLWVLIFPIVWATMAEKKEQQITLAKPIITLLQQPYHERQAHLRPNVILVTHAHTHARTRARARTLTLTDPAAR
jgi:transformation/transcription domain-associated protein